MTYDHELNLIETSIEYDEIGNSVPIETVTPVLCKLVSIGTNEFYVASAQGLKPEVKFIIHAFEYKGEGHVEFEDVKYSVIRTYRKDSDEIELTCQRVIGNA
ncbi:phage head closure protein [Sutcliffiella horikoshii]|uniref:Phage head-tail adapter protein n=1 Tax=Sutcliffiella horikoshii TaxID=79883 RepID=A0A5D4TFY3_9BACI|nr:phage head closure protein [Sutcliffiella horikoshii]TYS74517.1 phage head-tail adapter protein [Sutcliffiella horikoshii]